MMLVRSFFNFIFAQVHKYFITVRGKKKLHNLKKNGGQWFCTKVWGSFEHHNQKNLVNSSSLNRNRCWLMYYSLPRNYLNDHSYLRYMIVTIYFSIFFKVGGSVLLVSNALKLVSYLTKCECDDKIADFITPCLDFAYFIVVIWGSVLVFGK